MGPAAVGVAASCSMRFFLLRPLKHGRQSQPGDVSHVDSDGEDSDSDASDVGSEQRSTTDGSSVLVSPAHIQDG